MTRILVIDDDPSITSILKRGLSYEGFIVDVAVSGKEGLDNAREQPPNLVILDVMMPGLDGLEVCRRFRAADPNLPIMLLTAKDGVNDQVMGLETGADDYVVKPFTFEVLLARIRALLRRAEPAELRRSAARYRHSYCLSRDSGNRTDHHRVSVAPRVSMPPAPGAIQRAVGR